MDVDYSPGPVGAFDVSLLAPWGGIAPPGLTDFANKHSYLLLPLGVWAARGGFLVTNGVLRPGVGVVRLNVLPFTYNVVQAGVLALAIDVGAYKASGLAFDLLKETNRLVDEWIENVNLEELRQALGGVEFARLTANGTVKNINFLFQMPPMWLADP